MEIDTKELYAKEKAKKHQEEVILAKEKQFHLKDRKEVTQLLTEFTKTTGIVISGCGCCGSPTATRKRKSHTNIRYVRGKYV